MTCPNLTYVGFGRIAVARAALNVCRHAKAMPYLTLSVPSHQQVRCVTNAGHDPVANSQESRTAFHSTMHCPLGRHSGQQHARHSHVQILKRVNVCVSLQRRCGVGIWKPSSSEVVILSIIVANRWIVRMWSGSDLAEASRTHT